MKIDFSKTISHNDVVAVALSGGADSMALLHYMQKNAKNSSFKVIALNVEHGIRGESSKKDTEFVKTFCRDNNVELLTYTVDSVKHAQEKNLSIEQSARELRYGCFFDAIKSGKCTKVATAHHQADNAESILFNLLRGTGIKGVAGILENYDGKIIRPMLNVSKDEILNYVNENAIPFVTDETNLVDDYTRNYLRLNVIPEIKKIFPEAEKSITRFAQIAKYEDEFMHLEAQKHVRFIDGRAEIDIPLHNALLSRAVIIALKGLGLEKDWEKAHVDGVIGLCSQLNGDKISLKGGVIAIKEYDKIVLYIKPISPDCEFSYQIGSFDFGKIKIEIKSVERQTNLKIGLKADEDKIPKNAVIRFKKDGDKFTKFGGGTKSLGDFMTDKKIPLRVRDEFPLVAVDNDVLVIFGVAISDKIKVDKTTTKVVEFIKNNKGKQNERLN